MRHAIPLLMLLLMASPTFATDYTVSTPGAPTDAVLEMARKAVNGTTCETLGLAPTCTQAQARAKDSTANVYTTVADYLQRRIMRDAITEARALKAKSGAEALCRWWFLPSTTRTAQDGVCASVGQDVGCEICQ